MVVCCGDSSESLYLRETMPSLLLEQWTAQDLDGPIREFILYSDDRSFPRHFSFCAATCSKTWARFDSCLLTVLTGLQ